jgi:hypothetical protein
LWFGFADYVIELYRVVQAEQVARGVARPMKKLEDLEKSGKGLRPMKELLVRYLDSRVSLVICLEIFEIEIVKTVN